MQRILAATDLSPRGTAAVARAGRLARHFRAPLTLLHVVDEELPDALRRSHALQAKALLHAEAERLGPALGVEVEVRAVEGRHFHAIARTAEEIAADLVVVGASPPVPELGGRLGITTEKLMREVAIPVLAVRNARTEPYATVLVAVDLADAARRVLGLAHRVATAEPVHVLHVPQDPAGRDSTDAARTHVDPALTAALEALLVRSGFDAGAARPIVRLGSIDNLLPRVVAETKADLVVMGTTTPSRTALGRWLAGSHAEKALASVETDLLVVPLD